MSMEHWRNATMEDLQMNPEKYGAPTFDQFKANRDKWLGRWDDKFAEVDRGSQMAGLGRMIKKYRYEIGGRSCKTLEEVERVATELGIDLRSKEYDYKAQTIPQGGGTCEILVKFMSKDERERRESW